MCIRDRTISSLLICSKFVPQILERHLVEDRNFSMADLKNTSNETYVLQTKNGGLNIKVSMDPKDQKRGKETFFFIAAKFYLINHCRMIKFQLSNIFPSSHCTYPFSSWRTEVFHYRTGNVRHDTVRQYLAVGGVCSAALNWERKKNIALSLRSSEFDNVTLHIPQYSTMTRL